MDKKKLFNTILDVAKTVTPAIVTEQIYDKMFGHHFFSYRPLYFSLEDYPDLIREKSIKLSVTTGLEALGRSSDLNKLVTFWDLMGKVAPIASQLGGKVEPIANMIAASLNLDIDGFFYSEEEKEEQQNKAQQQALLEKAAPNIVNKYGDAMMQQQEMENPQPK